MTVTVTDVAEAPSAPSAPTVSGQGVGLGVTWEEPANTGPAITDYDVQYCKGAAAECGASTDFTDFTHTGTGRAATITGLDAVTEYQVQVRATNAEGTGEWSASGAGRTGGSVEVSFAPGVSRVVEGGTAAVTVALSAQPGRSVTIPLTVKTEGATSTDYSGVPAALTFGATETVKTVTVTAVEDTGAEGVETVSIEADTARLPAGVTVGSDNVAAVRIVDDDFSYRVVHASAASQYTVAEGVGMLSVAVEVRTPEGLLVADWGVLEESVIVSVATSDGTATAGEDYTAAEESLTFKPADFSDASGSPCTCARATKNVTVSITDDNADEPAAGETFTLTLSHGSGQRVSYPGGAMQTVTIEDDDAAPALTLSETEVDEDAGTTRVEVSTGTGSRLRRRRRSLTEAGRRMTTRSAPRR